MVDRQRPVDRHGDPLVLPLAGFLAEPPGSVRDYDVTGVPFEREGAAPVVRPLEGTVHLARTNRGIVLEAVLRTALAAECSRCLRPVEVPLELRLDEEVRPSIDLATGAPLEPEEAADPEATRLNGHHELDLRPLVAEAIEIAEPIAPLCEPGCLGLCPECGARLEPGHVHEDADIDPRLEALRGFTVDADRETE